MYTSRAEIQIQQPKWYIKRLCKHFAHKVEAAYSDSGGFVDFEPGICRMDAKINKLVFNISAEDKKRMDFLKKVISMHVEKLSQENIPNLNWKEAKPATK